MARHTLNRNRRNRLKVLRALYDNEAGISQIDLAIKAGMHTNRYWRLENGYAEMTPDERRNLARALRVQPGDLDPVAAATSHPGTSDEATVGSR